jgi:hypothetical protein
MCHRALYRALPEVCLALCVWLLCVACQVCTQFMGQEQPYFPASSSSMFWDQGAFDWGAIVQHCKSTWGVEPSWDWMAEQHGGLDWT